MGTTCRTLPLNIPFRTWRNTLSANRHITKVIVAYLGIFWWMSVLGYRKYNHCQRSWGPFEITMVFTLSECYVQFIFNREIFCRGVWNCLDGETATIYQLRVWVNKRQYTALCEPLPGGSNTAPLDQYEFIVFVHKCWCTNFLFQFTTVHILSIQRCAYTWAEGTFFWELYANMQIAKHTLTSWKWQTKKSCDLQRAYKSDKDVSEPLIGYRRSLHSSFGWIHVQATNTVHFISCNVLHMTRLYRAFLCCEW